MNIDLHNVAKVTTTDIGGKNSDCRWRDINFFMKNGEKLTINLYSDKMSNLFIKHEK